MRDVGPEQRSGPAEVGKGVGPSRVGEDVLDHGRVHAGGRGLDHVQGYRSHPVFVSAVAGELSRAGGPWITASVLPQLSMTLSSSFTSCCSSRRHRQRACEDRLLSAADLERGLPGRVGCCWLRVKLRGTASVDAEQPRMAMAN